MEIALNHIGISRHTMVWNALTFKTAGSRLSEMRDLHITALNWANQDAL